MLIMFSFDCINKSTSISDSFNSGVAIIPEFQAESNILSQKTINSPTKLINSVLFTFRDTSISILSSLFLIL